MLKKNALWNVLALRWFSAELQGILHIIVYNEYDMIINWRNFQLFIHSNQMISPSEDEKLQLKHFWQYNNIIKKKQMNVSDEKIFWLQHHSGECGKLTVMYTILTALDFCILNVQIKIFEGKKYEYFFFWIPLTGLFSLVAKGHDYFTTRRLTTDVSSIGIPTIMSDWTPVFWSLIIGICLLFP